LIVLTRAISSVFAHKKNGFAEVSKNLQLDIDLKIILINYQNNYVGHSNWLLEYENLLQHCLSCLSSLHNYFDVPTKLFSDLCLIKFLDLSKSSFSCNIVVSIIVAWWIEFHVDYVAASNKTFTDDLNDRFVDMLHLLRSPFSCVTRTTGYIRDVHSTNVCDDPQSLQVAARISIRAAAALRVVVYGFS